MPQKSLTIFTSTSDRTKKLKSPVQILLTLTPARHPKLSKPIVWKVLTFQSNGNSQISVKFHTDFGFSTYVTTYDDVRQTDNTVKVKRGEITTISGDAALQWSTPVPTEDKKSEGVITATNKSNAPQNLVLCCVNEDDDIFEPLVQLNTLMDKKSVKIDPPVMLQAYAAAGCKEGQLLDPQKEKEPLFSEDGKTTSIDTTALKDNTAFHLYSNNNGQIVLQKLDDDDDDDDDDDSD